MDFRVQKEWPHNVWKHLPQDILSKCDALICSMTMMCGFVILKMDLNYYEVYKHLTNLDKQKLPSSIVYFILYGWSLRCSTDDSIIFLIRDQYINVSSTYQYQAWGFSVKYLNATVLKASMNVSASRVVKEEPFGVPEVSW